MVINVLPMLINVNPMMTDVYPMLAEEYSVANPLKVAKMDEKLEKWNKHELATLLQTQTADELPDSLANISHIGYNWFYWQPPAIHW